MPESGWDDSVLARRTLIVSSIVASVALLTTTLLAYPELPLMAFAAVLIAILVDMLARPLCTYLKVPRSLAVTSVALGVMGLVSAGAWLSSPRIAEQVPKLAERFPAALERVQSFLKGSGWSSAIPAGGNLDSAELIRALLELVRPVAGVFAGTLSVFAGALAIVAIALFLAANPDTYVQGALRLAPAPRRERLHEVLAMMAHGLRWWIVGRLIAMGIVGLLTAVGLAIIGIPLAFTLAVIAGVLTFVPYIGPVTAAAPALLVAIAEGPSQAIYVVVLYTVVQLLENHLVTPLVQKNTVSLPPALLLTAQLGLGLVLGLLGLLLALPITVVTIVAVEMLYIEDVLHEPPPALPMHQGDDLAKPPSRM